MASDLTFQITFNSNGEPVIKNITRAVDEAKGGADRLGPAMDKADHSVKTVAKSGLAAAAAIADIGPSGHIAAQALTAMAVASGPVAVAFAVVAGAIAFVNSRVEAVRESFRSLAEREMKDLQREAGALKLDQAFRGQIQVLQSLDPELETIRQKYDQVRIAAERSGAGQATIARIATVAQLEQNRILDARQVAAGKIQQAIENEITARQLESAAVGKSGAELFALNAAIIANAANVRILAGEHGVLIAKMAEEQIAAEKLKRQMEVLGKGESAVSKFEAQFNVQLPINKDLAGKQLAENFGAVFNAFKNDQASQRALNDAFQVLVEKALALGLPNIPGLILSAGVSSKDFEQLKSTLRQKITGTLTIEEEFKRFRTNPFGGREFAGMETQQRQVNVTGEQLVKSLDQSGQAVKDWGTGFQKATQDALTAFGNVGTVIDQNEAKWNKFKETVAGKISLDMNTTLADTARDTFLRSIPERKTLTLDLVINAEALDRLNEKITQVTGVNPGFGLVPN